MASRSASDSLARPSPGPRSSGKSFVRGTLAKLCLFAGLLGAGACSPQTDGSSSGIGADFKGLTSIDLASRGRAPKGSYGTVAGGGGAASNRSGELGQIFGGSTPEPAPGPTASNTESRVQLADNGGQITPAGRGYQLNFENADVAVVAKAVLGDILQVNYSVDKRISGQITLTSPQPVPRSRLVPLLESSLAPLGASVVKDAGLYKIVLSADPGGIGNVDFRGSSEGFGTTVIPAKYLPAATLGHLLEGLGSKAGSVRVDPGTHYVIVQGSAAERQAALDAARLVDVNWLGSQSVGILPISNSTPETVIAELNQILDTGEGGLSQKVVKLEPMSRLNAILVVSRRREAVELVRTYVNRLDRDSSMSAGIKVYHLQYAQAKNVASVLNDMFGSGASSSEKDALEPSLQGSLTGISPSSATGGQGGNTGISAPRAGQPPAGPAPFGVLNVSLTDKSKSATTNSNDTSAPLSRAGSQSNSGGIRVAADSSSNSLFINTNGVDYRKVERAIRQIDRAPVQVDIEATIAEVTLTRDLQYGVQFFLQNNNAALGLGGATGVPLTTQYPGLNLLLGAASNPKVLLNALQGFTNVKILSSPSLVVLDRQPATLQVGDQVPILTQQAQSVSTVGSPVVNNVEYRDTGVILNVLPRISANGVVSLDIEQQISAVTSTDPTTLTPTISQRRVRSTIAVPNGQTVMLAGLISDKQSSSRSGLPYLSNIRFLNDLLTSHDSAVDRTEIVIFIKPQIISNGAEAREVAEEFRSRLVNMERSR